MFRIQLCSSMCEFFFSSLNRSIDQVEGMMVETVQSLTLFNDDSVLQSMFWERLTLIHQPRSGIWWSSPGHGQDDCCFPCPDESDLG